MTILMIHYENSPSCPSHLYCLPRGNWKTEDKGGGMKERVSLWYLAYIISLLRCLLGNWQFVKLTHFLGIILSSWKAMALFYKAPLGYRCLLSRFPFLLTVFEINQCTAIWAKGQRVRKEWRQPGPPSAGITSAQAQHFLEKPLVL